MSDKTQIFKIDEYRRTVPQLDGSDIPPAEGLQLLKAYCRVSDPRWRKRFLQLVERAASRKDSR